MVARCAFFLTAALAGIAIAAPTEKRQSGVHTGDGTFFDVGLGACGITNTGDQLVAAVGRAFFDAFPGFNGGNPNNNPLCNQLATVNFQGKTIQVAITDRCDGCGPDDLDFSRGAFGQLADLSVGRIHGVQWQLGGGGGAPAPAPAPAPAQPAGCSRTFTAVPGDNCFDIDNRFGISLATFLALNPSVNAACTNLQVGTTYCV